MESLTQKKTKKDDEHPLVAAIREMRSAAPAKKTGGLIPDETLKKVHLQRINQAMKRCQPDEWTEVKDPKEMAKLREEHIVRALQRNIKDLSRRGVEMTLSQYRSAVGI